MVFHENTDQQRRSLLDRRRREYFDQVTEIGHDVHLEEDWDACRALGATMQRDAARWHVTNPSRGRLDWSWMDRLVNIGGEELIIDYWHYGFPRWISRRAFLSPEFIEYAGWFACRVAARYTHVRYHLPCNEARVGADQIGSGVWRPFLRGRRDEAFAQVTKASIEMARQIKAANPNALVVTAEPVNSPDTEGYDDYLAAIDSMLGRINPGWRGSEQLVDVVGINHYAEPDNDKSSLAEILVDMRRRYPHKPLWVTEAGNIDEVGYFVYIVSEVHRANQMGARVEGVTQAPIISCTPWSGERRVDRGGFFTWNIDDPSKARIPLEHAQETVRSLEERGYLNCRQRH